MQALAYLPETDVIDGLNLLKIDMKSNFKPMLEYFEKNYIGKLKINSRSARDVPRYPISSWNLHYRVLNKLPRTNNAIESWHSRLKAEVKKEMTLNKLINLMRDEQSKTDTNIMSIELGNRKERPKASIVKDENLFVLCSEYQKKNIEKFLNMISLNLRLDLITAKEISNDSEESDESDDSDDDK